MFAALMLSVAQCVGPNCPVPVTSPRPVVARLPIGSVHVGDGWYAPPDQQFHRWRLYPVPGVINTQSGVWQEFNGKGYNDPSQLPADIRPPALNFGVTPREVKEAKYELNGRDVSAEQAYGAVMQVPDDSARRRVVVIGNESDRRQALQEIGKPDNAVVTTHEPDSWYARQSGFVTTGKPTVYVQEPDGRVLHRQDDLRGVGDAVRTALSYDPARDPDVRGVWQVRTVDLQRAAIALVVGLGGGFGVYRAYRAWDAARLKRQREQAAKDELFLKVLEKLNGLPKG